MTRDLTPYVPRLVLEWLRDLPDLPFRRVEGSVAFVDLSGFTAMSERLSRQGKIGAEEVTDAINSSFSRLLEVAYEDGGSLLKFGGDALLLFFSGEGHALRATHAATMMRRRLAEMGPIDTSAGSVRLRMSVGINSGEFDFFLVGDTHKELLITGPQATEADRMESLASSGEVVVSAGTARFLPPSALLRQKGDGWLIRRNVLGADRLGAGPVVPELSAEAAVPASLRQALFEGVGEEHRRVVICFIHFGGVDEAIATGDPRVVAEKLSSLVSLMQNVIEEEGVTFLGSDMYADGGKMILVAGAPTTQGQDEERLLRAVRRIFDSFTDLPLRAGIHAGHVFSGEIGPSFRRTFTVMGDAVNLSARLMQRAKQGEILTTAEVLDRSSILFESRAGDPFLPKGKSEPVVPLSVLGELGQRDQEAARGPFIGRDSELSLISRAMKSAIEGVGCSVKIIGDPGIGKSRLIEEAVAAGEAPRVFRIRSDRLASSTPYASVRPVILKALGLDDPTPDRLERSVTEVAPRLIPWLPLIGAVLGIETKGTPEVDALDPAFRKQRTDQAALELLAEIRPEPTVFVFDDAHWMDDASTGLVDLLDRSAVRHPWLVLVATRDDSSVASMYADHVVYLEPLDRSSSLSLARKMTNEPMPLHMLESLVERSGGNPLYITELTTSGLDFGAELPTTLESLIAARIDSLPPPDRIALAQLSVMGESRIDVNLASVLFDLGISRLEGLAPFIVVGADGSASFRQSLFRQVAYERLPFGIRRKLHSSVADRLQADPSSDLSILSMHHFLAKRYAEAWSTASRAGRDAEARWANVEAATLYRRAIAAARYVGASASETVSEMWERLGMVLELAGSFADAVQAFDQARKSADPSAMDRLAGLHLKQGALNLELGRTRAAALHFNRVMRMVEGIESAEAQKWHNRALLGSALIQSRRGMLGRSVAIATKALEIAKKWKDRPGIAHSQNQLHWSYVQLRKPERVAYRGKPIKILEQIGDLRQLGWVLNNVALDYHVSGEWDLAIAMHRRSKEVRERSGDVSGQAVSAFNIAEILSDRGEFDEALELLDQAKDIWIPAGFELGLASAIAVIGRTQIRMGRIQEGEENLQDAISRFTSLGARVAQLDAETRLAESYVRRGHPSSARLVDDLLIRAASTEGSGALKATLKRLQGSLLLGACDPEGARRAFEASLALAEEVGSDYEVASSLMDWASSAHMTGDDPFPLRERADELFSRLGVKKTEVTASLER